ncbi:MAG: ribonuclease P protein component [bacterium]
MKATLRNREDVERVFRDGRRTRRGRVTVLALESGDRGVRHCIIVSGGVGGAVRRNRFKRVLREELRRVAGELGGTDVVILCRGDASSGSADAARREARMLLEGLRRKK